MNIWTVVPPAPVEELLELANLAEELSVDGLAISDHLCVPTTLTSEYPYTGRTAILPQGTEFSDPVCLMAGLGARTLDLRFMTYVLLAPLHHPILLANALATAAVMTSGRIEVAAGVGWMREEFTALGIPFTERGARLDEALPLIKSLSNRQPVEHRGEHYDFASLVVGPRPPRPIPIYVGGHSPPALRRAARLADGWVGVNPTIEELRSIVNQLTVEREFAGTMDGTFVIRSGIRGRIDSKSVDQLLELAVDAVVVAPWQMIPRGAELSLESIRDGLPEVIARIRTASGPASASAPIVSV